MQQACPLCANSGHWQTPLRAHTLVCSRGDAGRSRHKKEIAMVATTAICFYAPPKYATELEDTRPWLFGVSQV